jgi:pantothenate kinase-related protein Tda10
MSSLSPIKKIVIERVNNHSNDTTIFKKQKELFNSKIQQFLKEKESYVICVFGPKRSGKSFVGICLSLYIILFCTNFR